MILNATDDGWTALRIRIFERDGGCIAGRQTLVGPSASPDPCRDKWGVWISYDDLDYLELDHVKQEPSVGAPILKRADKHSYKAPGDEAHLVLLCPNHHRGTGPRNERDAVWATAHRDAERAYLARLYPNIWQAEA